jgi:hypothetical protein
VDWKAGILDLEPEGWVRTNKRLPEQPLTHCLAGWLQMRMREDAARA